jgi:hypothetical protein
MLKIFEKNQVILEDDEEETRGGNSGQSYNAVTTGIGIVQNPTSNSN